MDRTGEHDEPTGGKFRAVLAECLRRIKAGEPFDLDQICAAHPDIATQLRTYFAEHAPSSRPDAPKSPEPKFERYRIVRQLGQGAMGTVYLANDIRLGRSVALKVPLTAGPEKALLRERFREEARNAAALSHPNICPVYDVGEENGVPYLTMAYIDGSRLTDYVGHDEMTDRTIVQLIVTLAAALQHAHDHGIIHRDLKPGNVMVDRQSQPFLTDFGVACRINEERNPGERLTGADVIVGTPGYMAPEQIDGPRGEIVPQTDIYALGAMFYELLARRLPFDGSQQMILAQTMLDRPEPPTLLAGRAIDLELETLCLSMLEKDPADRPASMKQVADTLRRWLANTSPVAVARKQRQSQLVDWCEQERHRIHRLILAGDFDQAVPALQQLAKIADAECAPIASWAEHELRRLRDFTKRVHADSGVPGSPDDTQTNLAAQTSALDPCEDAVQLIARFDYDKALELLRKIPPDLRTKRAETAQRDLMQRMQLLWEITRLLEPQSPDHQLGAARGKLIALRSLAGDDPRVTQLIEVYTQRTGRTLPPATSEPLPGTASRLPRPLRSVLIAASVLLCLVMLGWQLYEQFRPQLPKPPPVIPLLDPKPDPPGGGKAPEQQPDDGTEPEDGEPPATPMPPAPAALSFDEIEDQVIFEGESLEIPLKLTGGNHPPPQVRLSSPNAARYKLIPKFDYEPLRVTLTTGEYTVSPDEPIVITANDRQSGEELASTSFRVQIKEVNNYAPVFAAVEPQSIAARSRLSFVVSAVDDQDHPPPDILYSLEGKIPEGMTLDRESGEIKWMPSLPDTGHTHTIVVVAKEDLKDSRSAKIEIPITVLPPPLTSNIPRVDVLWMHAPTVAATFDARIKASAQELNDFLKSPEMAGRIPTSIAGYTDEDGRERYLIVTTTERIFGELNPLFRSDRPVQIRIGITEDAFQKFVRDCENQSYCPLWTNAFLHDDSMRYSVVAVSVPTATPWKLQTESVESSRQRRIELSDERLVAMQFSCEGPTGSAKFRTLYLPGPSYSEVISSLSSDLLKKELEEAASRSVFPIWIDALWLSKDQRRYSVVLRDDTVRTDHSLELLVHEFEKKFDDAKKAGWVPKVVNVR